MGLDGLIKFGYFLVVFTMGIMIWTSCAWAKEIEDLMNFHSVETPCTFNSLCSCTKAPPHLGEVRCKDAHFSSIPRLVNTSQAYMLEMDNTGLRKLDPYFFRATGLYRLDIANNPLMTVHDDAFGGLEWSLAILSLSHNKLVEIPSKAIRHLQKLKHLDLTGNEIDCIELDSFRGLEDTLEILNLASNSLDTLPADAFSSLRNLDSLDLSNNNLREIDGNVFRDGMQRLSKLNLGDNIFKSIPYSELSPLRNLRYLDMSYNLIQFIAPDDIKKPIGRFNLDALHLEYNAIEYLTPISFQYFDIINKTYLDGNRIKEIENRAFTGTQIRELYLRHCGLTHIQPEAFDGLNNVLRILDLSGNNLTTLLTNQFKNLDALRELNLRDNKISILNPPEVFNSIQYNIVKLDLVGTQNPKINLQELRRIRALRSLAVSQLAARSLEANDFAEYGTELEELKITMSPIESIKANAFEHVRGIKRLDLSENHISSIDRDAFLQIGHSLLSLRISHGFSGAVTSLSPEIFRSLSSLIDLDLSNNRIRTINENTFHHMKSLEVLDLNDNQVEQINKGTFQPDMHQRLRDISLRFNKIKLLPEHAFANLEHLKRIRLDDNKLEYIERSTFMDLDSLEILNLRGNKITFISQEGFHTLPRLEYLDIAFNHLTSFDFKFFDQVGTLSTLRVNASHNHIVELYNNFTSHLFEFGGHGPNVPYHSNIRVLDLSYNNISYIYPGYFQPCEISLTRLHLSNNKITNTTRNTFGNLMQLEYLDLSGNLIRELDFDTFTNLRKIQVLKLSRNKLYDISVELMRPLNDLRIFDASFNYLRTLPDNLFSYEGLEILDLSHNQLLKIPISSLSNMAAITLCELDLSHNQIQSIHSMDLSNKFRSLARIDLSDNKLYLLEDAVFATLPRLAVLDISNNNQLKIMNKAFFGLENSLIELNMNNVTLNTVPELPMRNLRNLNMAYNDLPSIPQELASNLSSLRRLDLSYNDITTVPLIVGYLNHLKSLSIAGNSLIALLNTSFTSLHGKLTHLDISQLNLQELEYGALTNMPSVRALRISPYKTMAFSIPHFIEHLDNLRDLSIEALDLHKIPHSRIYFTSNIRHEQSIESPQSNLQQEMEGLLPFKLRNVTFTGKLFNHISDSVLLGIRSPFLQINLLNTSLTTLPSNIFRYLGRTENISLSLNNGNEMLQNIPNPNSAQVPQMAEKVFLIDLRLSGNQLVCDCSLGWIEFWQRKKRQYLCKTDLLSNNPLKTVMNSITRNDCQSLEDDLRMTYCSNKNNQPLIEVLKSDLECGWGSSANKHQYSLVAIMIITTLLIWA